MRGGAPPPDGPQDELLLFVPGPSRRPASRDHRGLGLLPGRGRCGGRGRRGQGPRRRARRSRSGATSWRAATTGEPPHTSQGRALQPFIAEFELPRQAFEDVIDGVAMDLDHTRYQTFDDLLEYCRRVASAVGMICIRIFGCRSDEASRVRAASRRRAAADQHSPRRERRSRTRPGVSAARRSGGSRLH